MLHGLGTPLTGTGGSEDPAVGHNSNEGTGEDGNSTPAARRAAPPVEPEHHNIHSPSMGGTHLADAQPEIPVAPANQNTRSPKKTKAYLNIGTLNMNGGGAMPPSGKWPHMNQIVRENNLDVLCVQESHLTPPKVESLHQNFHRLHIINSYDPQQTNAKGVAIILNKHRTRWKEATSAEIIPGRAVLITIPVHLQRKLTILAIYAPNSDAEQVTLWQDLRESFEDERRGLRKPDIMLGDFNLVENRIDRTSRRPDHGEAVRSLQSLTSDLHLFDQWREDNPGIHEFTYLQKATGAQSRIDRIYVKHDIARHCCHWKNKHSGIESDHKLLTMKIDMPEMPFIGKGRWMIPPIALLHRPLIAEIKRLGETTLARLTEAQQTRAQDEYPPQKAHAALKEKIIALARDHIRKSIPKIHKQIDEKEHELKRVLRNLEHKNSEENDKHHAQAAVLEEELAGLYKLVHMKKRSEIQAKYWRDTETISKAWSSINREIRPTETIYRLRKPSTGQDDDAEYETKTEAMANLAAHYHRDLQNKDISEEQHPGQRQNTITRCLATIEQHLDPDEADLMGRDITEQEIESAIRILPNGKSPGPDGIPLELYQLLLEEAEADSKAKQDDATVPYFNIKAYLKIIIDDVARRPTTITPDTTNFADGWMCPLYKKNDRAEIANYRPITVLNTDYKIMTRALTTRMNGIAGKLIHPDQTGFMKGRHIEDQTDLTHMLTHLCEVKSVNGAIICLDQEKAYDKIRHDYLWKVLKTFKFPTSFIKMVQNLYANAHTRVMINGVMSEPFQVKRGVRQGDPLSCLLFNLAIEPLAEQLRKSSLRGLTIGNAERIVASLFADDTTVYLSENDNIADLYTLLEEWCKASGAKFNTSKTEIIPLGEETYRSNLRIWRAMAPHQNQIDPSIRIAGDGEATRVLGAWIGNRVDNEAIWQKKVNEITRVLERWNRGHPSQDGRRLIISMFVGGKTQYLTRVQGMPTNIEHKIEKIIRDFMWDKTGTERYHPPVGMDTLTEMQESGGRKVIDIKARNEAIDLMRLRSYLKEPHLRPRWTKVADELLSRAASGRQAQRIPHTHENTFLQKWDPTKRQSNALPAILQKMLKSAKKYNVCFDPPKLDENTKRQMPIWHHVGTEPNSRLPVNGAIARCIMTNHGVKTTGQMETLATTSWPETHTPNNECECIKCMEMENTHECRHPHACTALAKKHIEALGEKWKPKSHINLAPTEEDEENPNSQTTTIYPSDPKPSPNPNKTISQGFRAFTRKYEGPEADPTPIREETEADEHPTHVEVAIECMNQGTEDAAVQVALWYHSNNAQTLNETLRMNRYYVTEESGIIMAAIWIMKKSKRGRLTIESKRNQMAHVLTSRGPKAEDTNMVGMDDKHILRNALTLLRLREGPTIFKRGICDRAAEQLKECIPEQCTMVDHARLSEPHIQITTGMKLATATQSQIYQCIKEYNCENKLRRNEDQCHINNQKNTNRPATKRRLSITRACIADRDSGRKPDDRNIWKSLRNKNISKKIRAFMWLAMHDGQKVGHYWDKIPNYEHRAACRDCGTTETMDHILTECKNTGQDHIWRLVRNIFNEKQITWEGPKLGDMLGCGLGTNRKKNNIKDKGKSRLRTIIITESMHLIWKLRCEWRIGRNEDEEKKHTKAEIINKWHSTINTRLKIDCILTDKRIHGKKALDYRLIHHTWAGTLKTEGDTGMDWRESGVLVGIKNYEIEPHTRSA
ncbi:hypothetical protein CVT24_000429 [Panaeolus cyanescens]|uniref:Reverse transcriptase domain-containing protein n=1 Tax=Panaeolus cyanescens TaxID=181874 RepID=A0A409W717_9AGAR|nr:hypothetical protein CVT24_000429 [Panaeolus cyanescens]